MEKEYMCKIVESISESSQSSFLWLKILLAEIKGFKIFIEGTFAARTLKTQQMGIHYYTVHVHWILFLNFNHVTAGKVLPP